MADHAHDRPADAPTPTPRDETADAGSPAHWSLRDRVLEQRRRIQQEEGRDPLRGGIDD